MTIEKMSSWRERQFDEAVARIEARIKAHLVIEPPADRVDAHLRWTETLVRLRQEHFRALAESTRLLDRRVRGGLR